MAAEDLKKSSPVIMVYHLVTQRALPQRGSLISPSFLLSSLWLALFESANREFPETQDSSEFSASKN
jgi:hypothetical protein